MRKKQPAKSDKRLVLTQSRVRQLDNLDGVVGGIVCDPSGGGCDPTTPHCPKNSGG
jgi:uncharacterized protein (DUF779 family)